MDIRKPINKIKIEIIIMSKTLNSMGYGRTPKGVFNLTKPILC